MPKPRPRRERLEKLLELAQTYRGWSQRELARELERDPHNLVPDGGVPRLDLVLRLSEALDWPVEAVIRELCGDNEIKVSDGTPGGARAANQRAREHLLAGRYAEAIVECESVVGGAFPAADTAYALLMLLNSLEGQGRYGAALDAGQRGLQLVDPAGEMGLLFRENIANLHYSLGDLFEAEGIAASLEAEVAGVDDSDRRRHTLGFARCVRGHCHRRLAGTALDEPGRHARLAIGFLASAAQILDDHAAWGGTPNDAATANTCRGGVIEMRALLGETSAEEAIRLLEDCLPESEVPGRSLAWWLESRAWWCVIACNVALRHLRRSESLERTLAIFTNKADELAERIGNWALREQVWTIEHVWRRIEEDGRLDATEWILDDEEIRNLSGVMGRFPRFRETGWRILEHIHLERDMP